MTPKQIAVLDGKVVARTYDCVDIEWCGRYALKFEPNEEKFGDYCQFGYIYRNNYFNLKKMVEKVYKGETLEWRDASQY